MTQSRTRWCFLFMLVLMLPILAGEVVHSLDHTIITRVASNLYNPRGVAVLADGRLVVVEAGLGTDQPGEAQGSGRISIFADTNGDGDYDDANERTPILEQQPSYNSLYTFRTGHDEVFGLSDVVIVDNERIFYTKDDPFAESGHAGEEGFHGDTGIYEIQEGWTEEVLLLERIATLNAIVYDPDRAAFFVTESGFNQTMRATLTAEAEVVAKMPTLAHNQQPVPSGIALDPTTGDLLVTLFSGFVHDYFDTQLSFMPGDARVVRVNPDTGEVTDEIVGLTTAIDVAVDEAGNIFVVEMTTGWPPTPMPFAFDVYDPTLPPDPGGYAHFSGRVTMYPVDKAEPVVLADGLDTPTNITYANGTLYVSVGQGTPGRSVLSPDGVKRIEGALYIITGF